MAKFEDDNNKDDNLGLNYSTKELLNLMSVPFLLKQDQTFTLKKSIYLDMYTEFPFTIICGF